MNQYLSIILENNKSYIREIEHKLKEALISSSCTEEFINNSKENNLLIDFDPDRNKVDISFKSYEETSRFLPLTPFIQYRIDFEKKTFDFTGLVVRPEGYYVFLDNHSTDISYIGSVTENDITYETASSIYSFYINADGKEYISDDDIRKAKAHIPFPIFQPEEGKLQAFFYTITMIGSFDIESINGFLLLNKKLPQDFFDLLKLNSDFESSMNIVAEEHKKKLINLNSIILNPVLTKNKMANKL